MLFFSLLSLDADMRGSGVSLRIQRRTGPTSSRQEEEQEQEQKQEQEQGNEH